MKLALHLLAIAGILTLGVGCCGPMWHPGGCGPTQCGPGGCDTLGYDSGACASGGCTAGCSNGCGSCEGCGELYVDPWINHPADCCDPCDACGNFNGQSCGKCRSVFGGIKSLWGYRCDDGCGCDGGGCSGCDTGCDSRYGNGGTAHPAEYHGGDYIGGEYSSGETVVESYITEGNGSVISTGNRSNSRASVSPRTASRRIERRPTSPGRQIFQPRQVQDAGRGLAY